VVISWPAGATPSNLLTGQLVGGGVTSAENHPVCDCSRGGSAEPQVHQTTAGDPVDLAFGVLSETVTDLATPGRGLGLSMSRTYNSDFAGNDGPFGRGWSFSYGMSLAFSGGGPDGVTLTQEGGAQAGFVVSGGVYVAAAPRNTATLVHIGSTWEVTRGGTQKLDFDANGRLTSKKDLNGNGVT
jgi:YD repeat-containing protein